MRAHATHAGPDGTLELGFRLSGMDDDDALYLFLQENK
jgi:hypothetical protein